MTDRFCIDCRYFLNNKDNQPACGRYFTLTISPIYGIEKHFDSCENNREPGGKCGPEGFGWRPKTFLMNLLARFKRS